MVLILALVMSLGMAVPVWAGEADSGVWETKIVEVNGYSFEIQELLRDDLAIERRYINPTPDVQIEDVEQAKALLIALGMDAGNVELWSDASLLAALNGKDISMAVADYRAETKADTVNVDAATILLFMLIMAVLLVGAGIWWNLWQAERKAAQEKADVVEEQ